MPKRKLKHHSRRSSRSTVSTLIKGWQKNHVILFALINIIIILSLVAYIVMRLTGARFNFLARAEGNNYYVSVSGNDANTGTIDAPFKTFSKGVSVLVAGDTLQIMGGTYAEKITISKNGTESAPITIKSADTQVPVIIDLNNSSGPLITTTGTSSYITILGNGIEVKNSSVDCIDLNGQHNVLKNIVSHDCRNHGIYSDGQHNVIDGNTQYLSNLSNSPRTLSSGWGSAIKLRVGADDVLIQNNIVYHNYGEGVAATRSKNSIIRNNRIYDNYAVQIYVDNAINTVVEKNFATCSGNTGFEYLNGGRPNGIAIGEEQYDGWGAQLSGVTIVNNIVGFCGHGLSKWESNVNGGLKGTNLVAYNTFWGTTGSSISFEHDSGDQTVRIANNIANGNNAYINTWSGLTIDHNFWSTGSVRGTGDKVGNAGMATTPTNTTATTYRLSSTSTAIGAGASISSVPTDYEGKTRSTTSSPNVDMGALEFDTNAPIPTPGASPSIPPAASPSPAVSPSNAPSSSPADYDVNNDGRADVSDVVSLFSQFLGSMVASADFNNDGKINSFDFVQLVRNVILPSPLPSNSNQPNPSPSPSLPAASASPTASGSPNTTFVQVDPTSDSDNQVNSFIKNIVTGGNRKVAATGAWWGPVTRFFENQIWVVNRTMSVHDQVFPAGSTVRQEIACLLPGQNGMGTAKNTLNRLYQMVQQHDEFTLVKENIVPGQFYTYNPTPRDHSDALNYELRTICSAFEGQANNFGDGSAIAGDRIQVNMDPNVWINTRKSLSLHIPGTPHYAPIDGHVWYEDIDYMYVSLDGACNNGPCSGNGNMSNGDLIGGTVRGNLTVYAYLYKFLHESTVTFHHMEMRIDQNNEDYTVAREISPPTSSDPNTIGPAISRSGRKSFTLDTTKVSDGWHILSWHAHVIDAENPAPKRGKQMAGEIKLPICVNNSGQGNCP